MLLGGACVGIWVWREFKVDSANGSHCGEVHIHRDWIIDKYHQPLSSAGHSAEDKSNDRTTIGFGKHGAVNVGESFEVRVREREKDNIDERTVWQYIC